MSDLLIQKEYNIHQKNAYRGQISQPAKAYTKRGIAGVATSGGVKLKPGYPVFYNRTTNRYQVPTESQHILDIVGVCTYTVGDKRMDREDVEYEDGAVIQFLREGTMWVDAGEALFPFQSVTWDPVGLNFIQLTKPALEALTETSWDADARAEIKTEVDLLVHSLGYTRIESAAPRNTDADSLVEIRFSGAGIIL